MVEQRPVQTSAVYLLGPCVASQFPAIPPPSPPSPVTPGPSGPCTPIEELSLDGDHGGYVSAGGEQRAHTDGVANRDDSQDAQGITSTTPLDNRLEAAVHVLTTEAAALSSLSRLYATDALARDAFSRAVGAITRSSSTQFQSRFPGKLVLIGVGKSGHIARKLTATFNSLSVPATFLHPTEALHGDLGVINSQVDTALLITYSGKTPEITSLLPHLDKDIPLVLLTGAGQHGKFCDVVRLRPDAIVLPAPVHELETASFGVAAPTTSTTAAIAVGDALALICAAELHGNPVSGALADKGAGMGMGMGRVAGVFARNHPGGAIGVANSTANSPSSAGIKRPAAGATVRQIAAPWKEIPVAVGESPLTPSCLLQYPGGPQSSCPVTAADILRAGYASPSGWVRVCRAGLGSSGGLVSPGRIRNLRSRDLPRRADEIPGLVVRRCEFVSVAADTTVSRAADWVRKSMRSSEADGEPVCRADSVVGVLDQGECVGVLEVQTLLEHPF